MDYKEIIKRVAQKYNTTPEDVEREMQIAIDAAYANPSPTERKAQSRIACRGNRPTPEEFIAGVAKIDRKWVSSGCS